MPDEADIKDELPWPESLEFRDSQGRVLYLPDSITIADIVAMGGKVSLSPVGAPLKEGEFIHVPN